MYLQLIILYFIRFFTHFILLSQIVGLNQLLFYSYCICMYICVCRPTLNKLIIIKINSGNSKSSCDDRATTSAQIALHPCFNPLHVSKRFALSSSVFSKSNHNFQSIKAFPDYEKINKLKYEFSRNPYHGNSR